MSEQEIRINALEDEVKDLREQLRVTLKLLYRHGHIGMVGAANFPEDLGGMEDKMVSSFAESQGALLSRIAAVTDDDNDGKLRRSAPSSCLECWKHLAEGNDRAHSIGHYSIGRIL